MEEEENKKRKQSLRKGSTAEEVHYEEPSGYDYEEDFEVMMMQNVYFYWQFEIKTKLESSLNIWKNVFT